MQPIEILSPSPKAMPTSPQKPLPPAIWPGSFGWKQQRLRLPTWWNVSYSHLMWVCPMESYKVYTTGSDYVITKIILITKSRSQVSICPHIVNITSPAWSKLRSTRVRNTSLDSMGFSTNDSSWIESWVFVARDDCSIISLLFHVPLCPCCIQASNLNLLISFHGVPFARLWKGSFFECHFCNQVAFSNGLHPNNRPQLTCLACTPPPHLQAQGTLLARRDAISCMDGLWEQGLLVFEISNFKTWKPGFWKVHLQRVRSLLQIGSNSNICIYIYMYEPDESDEW